MAIIKEKMVTNPLTGKEAKYYTVYTDDGDSIGGTYNINEARAMYKRAQHIDDEGGQKAAEENEKNEQESKATENTASSSSESQSEEETVSNDGPGAIGGSGVTINEAQESEEEGVIEASDDTKSEEDTVEETKEEKKTNENPKSTLCYDFITKYAETKKTQIKRNPADNGKAEKEAKAKAEKYSKDFDSKCKKLYEAKLKEIELEYDTKYVLLEAKSKLWISKARLERFNSEDVETYTEGGIKLTMTQAMDLVSNTAEKNEEKSDKAADERAEKNLEKNIKDKHSKSKKEAKNKKEKNEKEAKDKQKQISISIKEDVMEQARQIGNHYDKLIDDFEADQKQKYNDAEQKAYSEAKSIGEPRGAEDVQKYNEALMKAAEKIVKAQQKAKAKAEIIKKSLIQKAKLKLGAMLGL